MSVLALRQQLAAILAPPRVGGAAAIPTGIEALDRALSDGGVPSGRLTEIQGARGSGRTTLVRQLVTTAIAARRWVAIVDGSRTLAPREWAEAGDSGRLWVIRPPGADRSAWCADILLRSSAFSLVVLDSGPALPRPVAIRLTRLAREHDVAVVVVGDTPVIGSAVRLRVTRRRPPATGHRPQERPEARGQRPERNDSRFTIHDSPVPSCSRQLETPEPVEVECADGQPRVLWWRGRRMRIEHPAGPERLTGDWWKDPYVRDYWRCDDPDGEGTLVLYHDRTQACLSQACLSSGSAWFVQGWYD